MCAGIDLIAILVGAIILIGLYYILNAIPLLSAFKSLINIVIGVLAALFVVLKILAPLFHCLL